MVLVRTITKRIRLAGVGLALRVNFGALTIKTVLMDHVIRGLEEHTDNILKRQKTK